MKISEEKRTIRLEPIGLRPLSAEPLVTVVVANYNYERYIGRTIESVLAQTYQNWELVLCDDGSTDNSLRVVEEYQRVDQRIRVLRKENGGHGSALNVIRPAARGEILCLLDSDDLYLPHKIERVVECFRREPDAGFVVHRVIRINQNGRRQGIWPMSDALPEGWHGPSLFANGGVLANLPPTSGISMRSEVAAAIFPMPVERPLVNCPDQVMMRLAPFVTPLAKIDEPLSEYRLHNANSYDAPRVTAEFARREILVCQKLWQVQHEFLERRDRRLAEQLKPVEGSFFMVYLRYLEARLSKSSEARACHAELMDGLRKQPGARYVRFWQWSIHLPVFLFDYAVNLMSRQSALKQLLARWKGLI